MNGQPTVASPDAFAASLAEGIVKPAEEQAATIREEADRYVKEKRSAADQYADQKRRQVEERITRANEQLAEQHEQCVRDTLLRVRTVLEQYCRDVLTRIVKEATNANLFSELVQMFATNKCDGKPLTVSLADDQVRSALSELLSAALENDVSVVLDERHAGAIIIKCDGNGVQCTIDEDELIRSIRAAIPLPTIEV